MKTFKIILSFLVFCSSFSFAGENYLTRKIKLSYKDRDTTIHLHYPESKKLLADKVERISKNHFNQIHKSFDYIPRSSTHIVINESSAVSNGSATPFPMNTIFLNDYPPNKFSTLSNSDDWEKILVIHEYVHILTLEMTHGLRDIARFFLGSAMKWSMFMPRWLAEGVATWAESEFTNQGRLNHPWIRSQTKRVLENKENCHSRYCFEGPRYYPYGSYAYWVGGFYLKYLEEQKKGTIKCLMYRYSKNLPFFISYRIKRCFGKGFKDSFHEFRRKFVKENKTACPLENKKLCRGLYKKYKNINWFKGFIDNDKQAIVVVSPNNNAQPYGGKDGEKIIIYNKKRKKIKVKYIDYVIEKVYESGEDKDLTISYLRKNLEDNDSPNRGFYIFPKDLRKLNKSSRSVKLPGRCDEALDFKKSEFTCKRYTKNSNWEIVKYKGLEDEEGEILHSFDHLENVEIKKLTEKKVTYTVNKELSAKEEILEKNLAKKEYVEPKVADSNYLFLKYIFPKYVFPSVISFSNGLTYLNADTSLVDPRARFTLSLGVNYVLGINDSQNISTPITGYSNLVIRISEKFSLIGSYGKSFVQTGINDNINIEESFGGGINFIWNIGEVSFRNGLYVFQNHERDSFLEFLIGQPYRRLIRSYSTSLNISHSTKSVNSKYRKFSLSSNFALKKNREFNEFYSSNSIFDLRFRWSKRLTHFFTGRYSRLFKNNKKTPVFRDGVIYGGGINSLLEGAGYQHPNYLIGAGNIFGNELISARTELNYRLFNIFEGIDFLGTYLETFSVFAGGDYINSRNLLYSNRGNIAFESFPQIVSGFAGIRTKFNFLYMIPLEIDVFAAYSDHPIYSSNTGWLLKSNLSF